MSLFSCHITSTICRRLALCSVDRAVSQETFTIWLFEWPYRPVARILLQAVVLGTSTVIFTTVLLTYRIHLTTWSRQMRIGMFPCSFTSLHIYPSHRPMFFSSQLQERTSMELSEFESPVRHRFVSLCSRQAPADRSDQHVSGDLAQQGSVSFPLTRKRDPMREFRAMLRSRMVDLIFTFVWTFSASSGICSKGKCETGWRVPAFVGIAVGCVGLVWFLVMLIICLRTGRKRQTATSRKERTLFAASPTVLPLDGSFRSINHSMSGRYTNGTANVTSSTSRHAIRSGDHNRSWV